MVLHQCFNTNSIDFHEWVFDHLEAKPKHKILELGCGNAVLWKKNKDRLPEEISVVLSDLSWGMALAAFQAVEKDKRFRPLVCDIQVFPARSEELFDQIIANHVFHHVPNLENVVQGIYEKLKPGGFLYTVTNGKDHMKEMYSMIQKAIPGFVPNLYLQKQYLLEDAPTILSKKFKNIEVIPFINDLWITEAKPLIAYIISMFGIKPFLTNENINHLEKYLMERIETEGGIKITKSTGIVIGSK
ncbi:MAG: class I SAM-dependent methyltransferase [Anaerolineaceae bacterium]|nr:class I SAM-dependent methyltransferase [Anaerolineaceae bacterium]